MDIGKWLFLLGCGIAFLGICIWVGGKVGIPFGKMPGDVHIARENFTFNFPIVTSIFISIVLTILINVVLAFWRK